MAAFMMHDSRNSQIPEGSVKSPRRFLCALLGLKRTAWLSCGRGSARAEAGRVRALRARTPCEAPEAGGRRAAGPRGRGASASTHWF